MLFIPAIDLMSGRCVRLLQGDFSKKVQYTPDPVETAVFFRDQGVRQIHVVDLDAARGPRGKNSAGNSNRDLADEMDDTIADNLAVIERIALKAGIPIEVGGGVRSRERVKSLLDAGAEWVVLGTVLVKAPDKTEMLVREFGHRLVAGIDARDGIVRVSGWTESGGIPALEVGRSARNMGFSRIIYTDIARDGMLEGPNLEEIKAMALETGLQVTASGGISGIEDLVRLKTIEPFGVTGVISGKAIYDGRLSVREACRLLQEGDSYLNAR